MSSLEGAVPFALAIFWSGVLGYLVARPLFSTLSREEKIAWSFGIGLLLQVALFSTLLVFRLEPRQILMLLSGLLLFLVARGSGKGVGSEPEPLPRAAAVLLAFAGVAWVLFLLQSVVEPMWANDYLAIWGFKGKTIFLSSSIPQRLFRDSASAWSHPEYPLLLPLFLAALSAIAGSWNDQALALLFPALSAALLLALLGYFRRRGKPLGGAIAVLLASLFFPLFQAFEAGMAEIPLAFALVLLVLSAADLEESRGNGPAARVAMAAFLCCGLKQEGTLFVLLLAAGMGARGLVERRRRIAVTLTLPLLLVPAGLNWAILHIVRGAIRDRDYDLSFLSPGRISLLLPRFSEVWKAALRSQLLPIALPAAAVVFFLLLTPRSRLDWLLAVSGAQLLVYISVCALSSVDPLWQIQFVPRISGVLFPVLCAVVGERSSLIFEAGPVGEPVEQAC